MNSLPYLIFGYTWTESTLKPILAKIQAREEELCLLGSDNAAGANREVRIRFRVKLTVKDLILLWELREFLPALTRLFIEDLYEKRVRKATPRCLTWEAFRDRLYSQTDDLWKVGRARARLLVLLRELRVFLWTPPRARKTHRLRTPSAKSSGGKTGFSIEPEISNEKAWEEFQHQEYLKQVGEQLESASHLLAAEKAGLLGEKPTHSREGDSPATGKSLSRIGQDANQKSGPLDLVPLSWKDTQIQSGGREASAPSQELTGLEALLSATRTESGSSGL